VLLRLPPKTIALQPGNLSIPSKKKPPKTSLHKLSSNCDYLDRIPKP